MSYFTTLGSPLYERFDNHETKKKCFLKTSDSDGNKQMFKVEGDACNNIKMKNNTIKVHLCSSEDLTFGGKCYQEVKEPFNDNDSENENDNDNDNDNDNEEENENSEEENENENSEEENENENSEEENENENSEEENENDNEGEEEEEEEEEEDKPTTTSVVETNEGEEEEEKPTTTSVEPFVGSIENFVGDNKSNLGEMLTKNLILKSLLFTCLFYLLSHKDSKNFILKVIKIEKENYLYLAALLFLVGYLILNLIV